MHWRDLTGLRLWQELLREATDLRLRGLSGEPTKLRLRGLLKKSTELGLHGGPGGVAELRLLRGLLRGALRDLRLPGEWCGLGLQGLLGEFTELKFGGLFGQVSELRLWGLLGVLA